VDEAYAHLARAAPRHAAALFKLGVLEAEERGEPLRGLEAVDRALAARGPAAAPFWAEKLVRIAAGMRPPPPPALAAAAAALEGLLEVDAELAEAPHDEDADDRDARLSDRRRHRRYLLRSAVILAEAVAGLPADAAAAQERARIRTTLGAVAQGLCAQLAAGTIEERDRAYVERAGKELAEWLGKIPAQDP
jgi:hypothetical protein